MTSRLIVQTTVTSVLVQPTILSQPVSSFRLSLQVQQIVLGQVSVSSSTPLVSGNIVPPPRGKDPNIPLMSRQTNVSGSQAHMVGMNQPFYCTIPNPVDPTRSGNIQYQHPYMAQVPFQLTYVPYGS